MIHPITRSLYVLLIAACAALAAPTGSAHAAMPAEIPMDQAQLDKFAGHYQMGPYITFTVRRLGDHLVLGFRNHRAIRIYPTGPAAFIADNRRLAALVLEATGSTTAFKRSEGLADPALGMTPLLRPLDFEIDFKQDARGAVTGFTLPGNGPAPEATRIDEATAEVIETEARHHIDGHVATPGAADALRRHLASVLAGQPDYNDMTPGLAANIRSQLPASLPAVQKLGAVRSVWFATVTPLGADIYNVIFEHGKMECRMTISPDGKIFNLEWLPGSRRIRGLGRGAA